MNLPKKNKMVAPKYQSILSGEIPVVSLLEKKTREEDCGAVVSKDGVSVSFPTARIIAGKLYGGVGPADTFSPVALWDVHLPNADEPVELPIDSGFYVMVFVRRGGVRVGDGKDEIRSRGLAMLGGGEEDPSRDKIVRLSAAKNDTAVLILGGTPLNEPIANRGPFTMNTAEELKEAFADYYAGKMGK